MFVMFKSPLALMLPSTFTSPLAVMCVVDTFFIVLTSNSPLAVMFPLPSLPIKFILPETTLISFSRLAGIL